MPVRQVVLLTPPKSSHPKALLSRQQSVRISPLSATLTDLPTSVANKRLTPNLTPLDATLTKNTGVGAKETELGSTRSFALSCRSLHQQCFTSLLQSIPSALFLKTAGVSPNNSHSETRRSPLITRHCIQVLSAHTLTNAPSCKPLRLTSLQMPGGVGVFQHSNVQLSNAQPVLDPNVSPPSSCGSLFTDHGSLPRAMLRFNVGGRHE
jgi:hypothetical protein